MPGLRKRREPSSGFFLRRFVWPRRGSFVIVPARFFHGLEGKTLRPSRRGTWPRSWIPLICGMLALCAGCAELAGLNPYMRRQWKEDESVLPTYYTHLRRIRALEEQVASMPPEEQQRVAAELTRLIAEERNTQLRSAAVRSLSAFPRPLNQHGIHMAASDTDPRLREAACQALERQGDAEALRVLATLIEHDDNLDVRLAAARGLSSFRDPQAVAALGRALDDTNPAIQLRAIYALRDSTGRNYGENIELWRSYVRGENPAEPPASSLASQVQSWFF